jgi:hypothetical protein
VSGSSDFFLIPFYLQAVQIHLANVVKASECGNEILGQVKAGVN